MCSGHAKKVRCFGGGERLAAGHGRDLLTTSDRAEGEEELCPDVVGKGGEIELAAHPGLVDGHV